MPEDLIEEIKRRCEAGGLSYAETDDSLRIDFPAGERTGSIWVDYGWEEHARAVLSVPFEDYVLLDAYSASWSPKRRVIECSVARYDAGHLKSPDYEEATARGTLRELGLDLDPAIPLDSSQRVYFDVKGDALISIGLRTNVQAVLDEVLPALERTQYLTLLIEDIEVETHGDAVDLLERVGNAVFTEVAISGGPTMVFESDSTPYAPDERLAEMSVLVEWALKRRRQMKGEELPATPPPRSIEFEYERGPATLYAYGGSIPRMPVLQFLTYYQVLEFYFHRYLRRKADQEIEDLLEEEPFDKLVEADRLRLLEAIRLRYEGKKLGVSERDMLETTIEECVSLLELRRFVIDNDERYYFFASRTLPKQISEKELPVFDARLDLRPSVAARIYDIRCRIVHVKAEFDTAGPLLPTDPAAQHLAHDIDLVKYLAGKVLRKSRRPLGD